MIFNIDFERLYRLLLPVFMRKYNTLLAVLQACVEPLSTLHNSLLLYRSNTARAMSYSSQTCYLRGMLNDLYDSMQRRIVVENTQQREFVFIYQKDELRPVMINQVGAGAPLVVSRLDSISFESGFTVYVPADFLTNTQKINEIKQSVEQYRLVTRYYTIKSL